jgi:uncharacterized protein YjiS (DUF1127 family)
MPRAALRRPFGLRLSRPDLAGLAALVALWRRRARTRVQLSRLPPEILRDIGIGEREAEVEARKPFWRG